jgi:geranylgeranyl diphosphate synthase type II
MGYSLFAGGKRLRPILCLTSTEILGGDETTALPVACALELIHTYSLIHDDLPAMDDDDLRRGKPTNHKVFGEAIAILAGDGLLTEAFHLMCRSENLDTLEPARLTKVIRIIAGAAGYEGMVGGQTVDIQMEGREVTPELLEFIHTRKTAAMIEASVRSGAVLGGANQSQEEALSRYGRKVGLAFQVADDILDIEGDSLIMGKSTGADLSRNKATYPALFGMERSRAIQKTLVVEAIETLSPFGGRADPLREIAHYIVERVH